MMIVDYFKRAIQKISLRTMCLCYTTIKKLKRMEKIDISVEHRIGKPVSVSILQNVDTVNENVMKEPTEFSVFLFLLHITITANCKFQLGTINDDFHNKIRLFIRCLINQCLEYVSFLSFITEVVR